MDNNSIEPETLDLEDIYSNTMLIDYLNNRNPMKEFFHGTNLKFHPVTFTGERSVLKEILIDYSKSIQANEKVFENLELVDNETVKFVVTGQQPGFLTGPLYTIYKTLSAIIYAEKFSTKTLKLLPLFWNASEDHDVEEVNNLYLLNKNNDIVPVVFEDDSLKGKSLERIPINKQYFTKLIDTIKEIFPETEYTESLFNDVIKAELNKSNMWGEYFSRLLSRLMGKWGLIIIEPKIFRSQLTEYFSEIITNTIKYNEVFLRTTDELNRLGYKPKMHKKENVTGLFYIDTKNIRHSIYLNDNGEYNISNGETLTKGEIINRIHSQPDNFSTNAIFRPIAQDKMIPTYIFVGGPSEIGYHIQIKNLYPEFSMQQPNLMFRMGATIIEKHINKVIEKYPLKITDLNNINQLSNRLLRNENKDFLDPYVTRITNVLDELSQSLSEVNQDLANRAIFRKQNILKELYNIEKMYLKYIKDDNAILVSQLEKAKTYLFPNNNPQERIFNIFQYLNKYSSKLINCIKDIFSKAESSTHVVLKCWML